ncbi:MAG: hypothetical protein QNJ84_04135 [Alphaproteobacteria bacterium]|nr:hypothetical protein [Alphaproteobacteria bacterium]
MTYRLEDLAADCREALRTGETPDALAAVKASVTRALSDPDFLAAHLGPENTANRSVLYEDPDLGFAICAHVYTGHAMGEPHDHGPTWAIYGQAEGVTEMTDWRVVAPAADGTPAKVAQANSYRLNPGDVHVYPTGAVHAPLRDGPTKLLRVEGQNTDRIARTPMVKAEG